MKRGAWMTGAATLMVLTGAWAAWRWTAPLLTPPAPASASVTRASPGHALPLPPPTEASAHEDDRVRLQGRVKDARGPVADARVLVSVSVPGESLSELPCDGDPESRLLDCDKLDALFERMAQRAGEVPVVAQGRSAADGSFALEVPRADRYTLWAEGAEGVVLRLDVPAGGEDIELVLDPGTRVSGVVRDEDEVPVAGALVTAIFKRHSRFFEAVTDGTGRFELSTFPRGDYALVVTAKGLTPTEFGFKAQAPRMHLKPTLTRPRHLSGMVLHEGRPVVGASVSVECYQDALERRVNTDARGHFAFDELPAQPSYFLEATLPGLLGRLQVDLPEPDTHGARRVTERTQLTVEMTPVATLRGLVRDQTGQPLADASVVVEGTSFDEAHSALGDSARTDDRGAYALDFLPPATYRVHVTAAGHLDSESQTVDLTRQGPRELDFVLAPATILSGVLVDAEGRPIENEYLHLTSPDLSVERSTRSGEAGRFTFDVPQAGRYRLQVEGPSSHDPSLVEVTAPADLRLSVKRLPSLRGEVVDDTGLTLSGVTVTLWPEDPTDSRRPLAYGLTDARGEFELPALTVGHYRLAAELILEDVLQTAMQHVTVEPRGMHARLVMEKGHALSGVVVDSRGRPVEGAFVEIVSPLHAERRRCGPRVLPGGGESGSGTGPDGRFSFQRVPDEAELKVFQEDHALACSGTSPGPQGVRLAPGTSEVRVVLVKKAIVRGRLVHADGSPVTSYLLNGSLYANPQGWFVWPFWCTGPLTLELSEFDAKPDSVPLRHTLSVQEEKGVDLGTLVLDSH